jgi:hypothetical protein
MACAHTDNTFAGSRNPPLAPNPCLVTRRAHGDGAVEALGHFFAAAGGIAAKKEPRP